MQTYTKRILKVFVILAAVGVVLLMAHRVLFTVRVRIVNEGDEPIRNLVLQGKGIGTVIYLISAGESVVVSVCPALETDLRFEYSMEQYTYRGVVDEYLTRGCSGWITLNLDPEFLEYRWEGRLRAFCFQASTYSTHSAMVEKVFTRPMN